MLLLFIQELLIDIIDGGLKGRGRQPRSTMSMYRALLSLIAGLLNR